MLTAIKKFVNLTFSDESFVGAARGGGATDIDVSVTTFERVAHTGFGHFADHSTIRIIAVAYQGGCPVAMRTFSRKGCSTFISREKAAETELAAVAEAKALAAPLSGARLGLAVHRIDKGDPTMRIFAGGMAMTPLTAILLVIISYL